MSYRELEGDFENAGWIIWLVEVWHRIRVRGLFSDSAKEKDV